jgi:SAM-dependent methyltransferase
VIGKILEKEFTRPLRILEVGAGTGDSIAVLRENYLQDSNCFVVEPNPSMWPAIIANGIQIVKDFTELEENSFDVIMGFEVLEHILNPFEFLQTLRSYLRNDGVMIFSTPNAHSIEVQLLRDKSTTLDIEHISVLSPAGIHSLAARSNLKVDEIITPGDFDVELLTEGSSVVKRVLETMNLGKETVQKKIAEFGFSSHMKTVLSKRNDIADVRKF